MLAEVLSLRPQPPKSVRLMALLRKQEAKALVELRVRLRTIASAPATPQQLESLIRATTQRAILHLQESARAAVRTKWGASAIASIRAVDHADLRRAERAADGLARAFRSDLATHGIDEAISRTLSSNAERTAATETAAAVNDETLRQAKAVEGADVVMTWNAALDRHVCSRCSRLDGATRTMPDTFGDDPPLHPNCRCVVDIDIIRKSLRDEVASFVLMRGRR